MVCSLAKVSFAVAGTWQKLLPDAPAVFLFMNTSQFFQICHRDFSFSSFFDIGVVSSESSICLVYILSPFFLCVMLCEKR